MTVKTEKIGTIEAGDAYVAEGSLPEQIEAFQELGIHFPYVVDTQRVVDLWLAGFGNMETRTSVMPVAMKGRPTILARPSQLMIPYSAVEAATANFYPARPADFYNTLADIARAEKGLDPAKRTVIALSFKGDANLTADMDETRFLLGPRMNEYFEVKVNRPYPKGIQFRNLTGTSSKEANINYILFGSPSMGSSMHCNLRDLYSFGQAIALLEKAKK